MGDCYMSDVTTARLWLEKEIKMYENTGLSRQKALSRIVGDLGFFVTEYPGFMPTVVAEVLDDPKTDDQILSLLVQQIGLCGKDLLKAMDIKEAMDLFNKIINHPGVKSDTLTEMASSRDVSLELLFNIIRHSSLNWKVLKNIALNPKADLNLLRMVVNFVKEKEKKISEWYYKEILCAVVLNANAKDLLQEIVMLARVLSSSDRISMLKTVAHSSSNDPEVVRMILREVDDKAIDPKTVASVLNACVLHVEKDNVDLLREIIQHSGCDVSVVSHVASSTNFDLTLLQNIQTGLSQECKGFTLLGQVIQQVVEQEKASKIIGDLYDMPQKSFFSRLSRTATSDAIEDKGGEAPERTMSSSSAGTKPRVG